MKLTRAETFWQWVEEHAKHCRMQGVMVWHRGIEPTSPEPIGPESSSLNRLSGRIEPPKYWLNAVRMTYHESYDCGGARWTARHFVAEIIPEWSCGTMYSKMQGETTWTKAEVRRVCRALEIPIPPWAKEKE